MGAMSTLLALDTSGTLCSVALRHGDTVLQETRSIARQHNLVFLEMLDALCARAGILPSAVEGVAYVQGPGSFTGVRLGVSAVQAIALAAGASVFGATTSRLLAWHAARLGVSRVVTSVRSRGEACYIAGYGPSAHGVDCELLEGDVLVEAPPAWLAGYTHLVGDAPAWLDPACIKLPADPAPALTLLEHAASCWPGPPWGAVETALPLYIEGDHPWRPVPG